MIIIMLVSLYTSRVVLAELGVDDYGIYMVVGGVVTMFGFLNSCMTTATQRYLNYEMERGGEESLKLKQIFTTALTIHLIIAIVIVFLAETIGLWFVNTKLVIPSKSIFAANVVYQTAIMTFCATIFRVPFNAAIISHERMHIYAFISILEAFLLLASAYLLMLIASEKLAYYGLFTFIAHLIVALCYICFCLKSFQECSLKLSYIPPLFKEMLKFAGWNMFGSIAWIARSQGVGIILNIFFGPALNAAKGIADQVSNAVNSLMGNFQMALNPQITKNYASGNIKDMELLAYRGIKFSCMLVWMMALPIMINASTILSIWLTDVPPYASLFVILILIDCFSNSLFGNPLMTSLSATGKIRNYQVVVSCVLLLILPASYITFKCGLPPETVLYLNIFFNISAGITRFYFCSRQINYSSMFYMRYAFLPVIGIVGSSTIIPILLKILLTSYTSIGLIPEMVILIMVSIISVGIISWYFGLTCQEKMTITRLVKARLEKH